MRTWKPRPFLRLGSSRLAGGGIAAASASSLAASLRASLLPPFLKCGSLAWRMRFISSGDSLAAFLAAACKVHRIPVLFIQHNSYANTEAGHNRLLDTELHQALLSSMLQLQRRKSTLTAISQCLVFIMPGISSCLLALRTRAQECRLHCCLRKRRRWAVYLCDGSLLSIGGSQLLCLDFA